MSTGSISIRAVSDASDRARLIEIVNETTPDDPTSLEALTWSDETYPGTTRLLADLDGTPVGVATAGRIHVYPADHEAFWATIAVRPIGRRRGIGTQLLVAVSEHARAAGKTALYVPVSEARPDGIEFLRNRGFHELERSKTVRLDLAGVLPPPIEPPAGIELRTLAEAPELVGGVHAVALEAIADIPGGETAMAAGDLAEFQARDVDRPGIPPEAFFIALDRASGRVVGYASLIMKAGSSTTAWHDMTAVLRSWRRQGIAGALKRALIGWAVANGLVALESGNDEDNAPMRAVNARLGYQPLPDRLTMRGPLFDGIMTR
ncbi:MAG: GNAT family N-acetyltransferase [Chloroflexi bacterium]|nr:GNAT family N-acetyltransferase [Chloroflexota bacterium]